MRDRCPDTQRLIKVHSQTTFSTSGNFSRTLPRQPLGFLNLQRQKMLFCRIWQKSCRDNSDREGNDGELKFRQFGGSYNFSSRNSEQLNTTDAFEVV